MWLLWDNSEDILRLFQGYFGVILGSFLGSFWVLLGFFLGLYGSIPLELGFFYG